MFQACEICGADNWTIHYEGPVRDGTFGSLRQGGKVGLCGGCGAARLAENFCLRDEDYQGQEYRERLGQSHEAAEHLAAHDVFQKFSLEALVARPLRGLAIADIGCAAGTFLDHVRGVAGRAIGIEPNVAFHDYLRGRGCEVYPYAGQAAEKIGSAVDLATSFQVIEHTGNPRSFLAEIKGLLKPEGELVVTTPNRDDILLDIVPDDFPPFFYRTVHRWYFDAASLAECARLAGYRVQEVTSLHRYGLSNALAWARDRRPKGWNRLPGITSAVDAAWKTSLEQAGRGDTLVARLKID
jgi:SAM-dependent methyltransferase